MTASLPVRPAPSAAAATTPARAIPSPAPSVSFVVVNWNQRALTLACLASLAEQRYPDFRVVLVDNGSHDGTLDAVRAGFPDVGVYANASNVGIAAANNVGIRDALAAGSDYVFLLNNDTTVAPDMLATLVAVAESNERIGVTGPTMLYFDRPGTIWCAGNRIDWRDGSTTLLRDGEAVASIEGLAPQAVDYVASCAACVKREVFEDVGLMDERYFIYYDETDWFARAAARGWRTLWVPEARMWHKVSASMRPASPATTYYMSRNRLRFVRRHAARHGTWRAVGRAVAGELWTIAAHSLKPRYRHLAASRTARALALRDAALGRFGPMGADVEAVCFRRDAT